MLTRAGSQVEIRIKNRPSAGMNSRAPVTSTAPQVDGRSHDVKCIKQLEGHVDDVRTWVGNGNTEHGTRRTPLSSQRGSISGAGRGGECRPASAASPPGVSVSASRALMWREHSPGRPPSLSLANPDSMSRHEFTSPPTACVYPAVLRRGRGH